MAVEVPAHHSLGGDGPKHHRGAASRTGASAPADPTGLGLKVAAGAFEGLVHASPRLDISRILLRGPSPRIRDLPHYLGSLDPISAGP